MARKNDRRVSVPNTGNEEIPPGATAAAADRPIHRGGGAPGSGAGPRHAANDPGSTEEEYGPVDSNVPSADGTLDEGVDAAPEGYDEQDEGYGGPSGGAVGGTPAGKRSRAGRHGHGIRPGTAHHGDSTVGVDPEKPAE